VGELSLLSAYIASHPTLPTALMMFVNSVIRRMLFNFSFIQKLMIIGIVFTVGTTLIGLFLEIWTAIKYKQLFGSTTIQQRRSYINDLRLYGKLQSCACAVGDYWGEHTPKRMECGQKGNFSDAKNYMISVLIMIRDFVSIHRIPLPHKITKSLITRNGPKEGTEKCSTPTT
jgi:hypothetical protein